MRYILALVAGLLVGASYAALSAQPPTLTPQQQCEVDRHALQAQVVQLRAQLVAAQTQIDRATLDQDRARITGALPVVAGYQWDWATLRYVPTPPATPAKDTP